MAEVVDQTTPVTFTDNDLVAAVRQALQASMEPLTLSKIRSSVPTSFRSITLEALEENLNRQVAANVLHQFPKYRSPQNRYWDRPMHDHVVQLLRTTLEEKPLALSELRRKLPDYAKTQAESVLDEQVAQGRLHRHPSLSSRSGPRFGVHRPDPKEYLRTEMQTVFGRLEQLGFTPSELREGAMELLNEEEWGSQQAPQEAPQAETPAATMASGPQHQNATHDGPHQQPERRHESHQHGHDRPHEVMQHTEERHHEPQHPTHGGQS